MEQRDNKPREWGKGGRPLNSNPANNCVMVQFHDVEYARFLTMYEQSGVYAMIVFIKARVLMNHFG